MPAYASHHFNPVQPTYRGVHLNTAAHCLSVVEGVLQGLLEHTIMPLSLNSSGTKGPRPVAGSVYVWEIEVPDQFHRSLPLDFPDVNSLMVSSWHDMGQWSPPHEEGVFVVHDKARVPKPNAMQRWVFCARVSDRASKRPPRMFLVINYKQENDPFEPPTPGDKLSRIAYNNKSHTAVLLHSKELKKLMWIPATYLLAKSQQAADAVLTSRKPLASCAFNEHHPNRLYCGCHPVTRSPKDPASVSFCESVGRFGHATLHYPNSFHYLTEEELRKDAMLYVNQSDLYVPMPAEHELFIMDVGGIEELEYTGDTEGFEELLRRIIYATVPVALARVIPCDIISRQGQPPKTRFQVFLHSNNVADFRQWLQSLCGSFVARFRQEGDRLVRVALWQD